jgi:hypothetical protein
MRSRRVTPFGASGTAVTTEVDVRRTDDFYTAVTDARITNSDTVEFH